MILFFVFALIQLCSTTKYELLDYKPVCLAILEAPFSGRIALLMRKPLPGRECRGRRARGQRTFHDSDAEPDSTRVLERRDVRRSLDDGVCESLRCERAVVRAVDERRRAEDRHGGAHAAVHRRPAVLVVVALDRVACRRHAELSVALLAAAELEESAG